MPDNSSAGSPRRMIPANVLNAIYAVNRARQAMGESPVAEGFDWDLYESLVKDVDILSDDPKINYYLSKMSTGLALADYEKEEVTTIAKNIREKRL